MTDLEKAAQQALEALEFYYDLHGEEFDEKAITALRQALANDALDRMAENARELGLDYEPDQISTSSHFLPEPEQPAQQEPVEEFAYKAITKRGEHCHFGTHAAARIWAGEGGEVETIKLRHLELVEQPAQPSKPWVGLTDAEANELWESTDSDWELMKRTEAKLREKNA